jgi:tetratricopeptide (TPR) repeat protein
MSPTGDIAAAHAHALTCAAMYRDHGVLVGHARALASLANASASLGRFDDATRHAEAGLALSRSLGIPTDAAVTVTTLCGLYRHLRRPDELERALVALREFDTGTSPRNDLFHLVAHAQREAVHGRHSGAAHYLMQAREQVAAAGQHLELHFVLPLLAGSLVGADRLIEAEQTCDEIEHLPRIRRDRNLQGALLHCRAQLAHALGDRAQALARLRAAIDVTPAGWWNAQARLDAAWLLLEDGRPEAAATGISTIPGWLPEHPIGRLVDARLSHVAGRLQESRSALVQLAASLSGSMRDYVDAVGASHEMQSGALVLESLPRARRLATCL